MQHVRRSKSPDSTCLGHGLLSGGEKLTSTKGLKTGAFLLARRCVFASNNFAIGRKRQIVEN